jgi:ABC-2 type transport system permease protein
MSEIRDEWKKILSGNFIILMLIIPVVVTALFSYLFQNGIAEEVPLAVVDMDHSTYSRQLIEKLDASQYVTVSDTYDNYVDVDSFLYNERYSGVLYLPYGLETAYTQGKTIKLGLYVDMTMSSCAGSLKSGVSEVLAVENAAKGASVVLNAEQRSLYNPTRTMMMSTVMMFINVAILAVLAIYTMPIVPRLRQEGLFFKKLKNPLGIILRNVPYALVCTISLYFTFGILKQFAHLRFEANWIEIFVPFFLFAFSSSLMSMAIGWNASSPESASGRVVFIILPSTLLGGASFPSLMMPIIFKCINKLIPFSMHFKFLRGMGFKGGHLRYFMPELGEYFMLIALFAAIILVFVFCETKKGTTQDDAIQLHSRYICLSN